MLIEKNNNLLVIKLSLILLVCICTGCVNKIRMTEPARSLAEELLVSTSIDRSLSSLDPEAIGRLKGFKVNVFNLTRLKFSYLC